MQNNYDLQKYSLVISHKLTCSTFLTTAVPQVVAYYIRERIASKLGSRNCVMPKSQPLKFNIFVDRACKTVKLSLAPCPKTDRQRFMMQSFVLEPADININNI